jgi:hypothetical protein
MLWDAMRANVVPSKDSHKAWIARLACCLQRIGVLCADKMGTCGLPDLDLVAQAILQ